MTLKLRLDDIMKHDELKDISRVVADIRALPPPSGYELLRRGMSIHGEYIQGSPKYFIHVKERARRSGEERTFTRSFAYVDGTLINTEDFRRTE